jgi:predicted Ser/Thr protein kinase
MARDTDPTEYIEHANDELQRMYDQPLTIQEYIDHIFENPSLASHSAKYLLEAIEFSDTRTVVEHGEELERYVFFDDPYNDGEHAILGNTKELNEFVSTLRNIASGTGKTEKMIWIEGPTATGKSEFKRCLINGLREYSKTASGSRYTLEWSEEGPTSMADPTYDNPNAQDRTWHESPVQTHPLSLLPEGVQEQLLEDLNANERYPVRVTDELDPFSDEFFTQAAKEYRDKNRDVSSIFEKIAEEKNVRVTNYVVDVGQGIGVLHSEDVGNIKQKLVGSWMQTQNLWSKGRRNPHAFSYDGVLCQGNGLLTVLEDAASHKELLTSLLNIIDEKEVKLDQQTKLPIDTQFLIISNPDLAEFLSQQENKKGDPLKALRRRMEKHELNYLTNYTLETKLIKRELVGENDYNVEYSDEINVSEPVYIQTYEPDTVNAREIAPHGIEAAAMYNVITRLTKDDLGDDFTLSDKAVMFDRGELYRADEEYTMEDVPFDFNEEDGRRGIPVTFTRDVIAETITEGQDRTHKEFDFENIILPQDIIDAMVANFNNEPMFSPQEANHFQDRAEEARNYIFEKQEEDVLQAFMEGLETSESSIEKYIDEVYEWYEEKQLETETGAEGSAEIDALSMKLFEIEELGMFTESDYNSDHEPVSGEIVDFREEHVVNAINSRAWESKQDDFTAGDLDIRSMGVFNRVLRNYGWQDVRREFPDFDPSKWDDPPKETETKEAKDKVINNMIDIHNYTRDSAELTSKLVIEEVSKTWD